MPDEFLEDEVPMTKYAEMNKPHPVDLLDGLGAVDQLEYVSHLLVAAAGPWVSIVEDPGETPGEIVAESAVISGALMSMHESLERSRVVMHGLMAEHFPAAAPRAEAVEEPGAEPTEEEELAEEVHEAEPPGRPDEAEPDAATS